MKHYFNLLAVIICICMPLKAGAAEDIGKVIDSLGVPLSPAFSALGVTPEKIIRPGTVRDLALAVLQGVDENGNFQNGFAVDSAWFLPLFGQTTSLAEYQERPGDFNWIRFWSRNSISVGASKGSSEEDESVRLSVGVRQTIFDEGDPRLDMALAACIDEAHRKVLHRPLTPAELADPITKAAAMAEREKTAEALIKPCREASIKRNYGKPAMDIGITPIWSSEEGKIKNLDWQGLSTWTSIQGTVANVLLIGNVHIKLKDLQAGDDGTLREGRGIAAGVKARYGSASYGVLAQGVYNSFNPSDGRNDDYVLYSLGGEIKLAEKLWLEASFGGTSGKGDADSGFVSGQFKWSFSESSNL